MNRESKISLIFRLLLLLFIFSLFLTLGSDRAELLTTRMVLGAVILAGGALLCVCHSRVRQQSDGSVLRRKSGNPRSLSSPNVFNRGPILDPPVKPEDDKKTFGDDKKKGGISLPLILFSAFFLFEILRAALAGLQLIHVESGVFAKVYLFAPLKWFFYLGFFSLGYLFFKSRSRVWHLTSVMAWSGFFLAVNAAPALLKNGVPGYTDGQHWMFFYPVFYFHSWIEQYLFGSFAHLNYIGDLTAFGFFSALGMAFYTFQTGFRENAGQRAAFLALQLTFALLMAAVILLLFSRGTILFFALTLLLFLLASAVKFPKGSQWMFVLLIFAALFGFLRWAGNFQAALKEVGTLQAESQSEGSLAHNMEGAGRALRIYHAHPVWGAGTDGYSALAQNYATPGSEEKLVLANFEAMCHYLQVLAEEGAGALFYFLFLLAYFWEALRGLFMTKSRFKFVAALSFFAAVLLVLGHAAINHLMQRFPISLLVYIAMGASLGILRDDFQHE